MPSSGAIPVYVINLDRSPERLAHMTAQLGRLGVNFERIRAVEGRELHNDYVAKFAPMAASQIGCFLSHKLAWQKIAWGDAPYGIVLEDDIHIAPVFAEFARSADWIPTDADLVKLETMLTRVSTDTARLPGPASSRLARLRSLHPGTAAFVLSQKGARTLLEAFPDPVTAADGVIFGEKTLRLITTFQADPAPCIQDRVRPADEQDARLAATINAGYFKPRIFEKVIREARRLADQAITLTTAALQSSPPQQRLVVPFAGDTTISRFPDVSQLSSGDLRKRAREA